MKGCLTGHILCLLFFVITTAGCDLSRDSEPAVRTKTLDHVGVYTIKRQGDYLYAGTGEGLFRKHIDTLEDSLWEKMNLDRRIRDFAVLSKWEIIAGAAISSYDANEISIYRTSDKGISWQEFQNNYGGKVHYNGVKYIERHPDSPEILFARGPGLNIIKSTNGGRSWRVVSGWWDSSGVSQFIKFDFNNPKIIWAGGMDVVFQPSLIKSTDGGNHWSGVGLPRNGGIARDIVIHQGNSNRVIVTVGSGIYKYSSSEEKWEFVNIQSVINTLDLSMQNTETVYASGRMSPIEGQPLFIERSLDFGESWETIILDSNLEGVTTYDLRSIVIGNQEIVLMATDHGMKRYYPD